MSDLKDEVSGVFKLPNPKIESYLRILQKINDIYSDYEVADKDLLDEINYYEDKENFLEQEIKEIQNKCEIEWKELLIKLCENLITKIESRNDYKKILKVELKEARKIRQELIKEKKTIEEYEKTFDNRIIALRDSVEINIAKYGIEKDRFWINIVFAILIAVGSIFLGAYLQKWGLMNWI